MIRIFENLPIPVQEILNQRLGRHGINAKKFYETPDKFPEGFEDADLSTMLEFLEHKEVSHILPQSKYPDKASDIDNVIWEDIAENKSRSDNIMTSAEYQSAQSDNLQDLNDLDFDDDGLIDVEESLSNSNSDIVTFFDNLDNKEVSLSVSKDVEEHIQYADATDSLDDIIGVSLLGGMVYTGIDAYAKINKGEISLDDAPRFFFHKTGTRVLRLAVIGTLIATGSPVIVGGTVGYITYKSRSFLKKLLTTLAKDLSDGINDRRMFFKDTFLGTLGGEDISQHMPSSLSQVSKNFKKKK